MMKRPDERVRCFPVGFFVQSQPLATHTHNHVEHNNVSITHHPSQSQRLGVVLGHSCDSVKATLAPARRSNASTQQPPAPSMTTDHRDSTPFTAHSDPAHHDNANITTKGLLQLEGCLRFCPRHFYALISASSSLLPSIEATDCPFGAVALTRLDAAAPSIQNAPLWS